MTQTMSVRREATSAAEQVESLLGSLPAVEAFAALERLFGVQPLLAAFLAGVECTQGALGLFSPTPDLTWEAAAVAGERSGGELVLHGETRLASPRSDGFIVLVRLDGAELRLAWVEQRAAAGWLSLDGARVGGDNFSEPVSTGRGSALAGHLEAYAAVWALAAAVCAGNQVRALRRAARTTLRGARAFSTSQLVAMGITELEIEAELTLAAVHGAAGGLRTAAAAARTLHAIAAKAAELRDQAGLVVDGEIIDLASTLTAFLGGPLLIENELARALGIPEAA